MLVEAATGLPTILFTAALVVVVCFWLLVAVGATTPESFDSDAELDAWGMGGVPVAVAFSLLTVLAWVIAIAGVILLALFAPEGFGAGLPPLLVPVGALLAAWRLSRLFVRPLHRLFPDEPDEPGPSRSAPVIGNQRIGDDRTASGSARDRAA